MFSAISQKTGLSNVTPILGTSDNGNGTNLAIIGFNSEPDKKAVSTAASFANSSYRLFSTEMGNDSNLLIVFYVQIMPDDFVMQLHRF